MPERKLVKLFASVTPGSQYLKERKVKLFDFQGSRQGQGLFEGMVKLFDHS